MYSTQELQCGLSKSKGQVPRVDYHTFHPYSVRVLYSRFMRVSIIANKDSIVQPTIHWNTLKRDWS